MLKNKNMTHKDLNNIKGGIRKAFVKSDLYMSARLHFRVEHSDPKHPRCKKWSFCNSCGIILPEWKTDLDHIEPMIPINSHFEDMPIEESIHRLWCDLSNIQPLCQSCHYFKSSIEKNLRKPYNKPRNKSTKLRKKNK